MYRILYQRTLRGVVCARGISHLQNLPIQSETIKKTLRPNFDWNYLCDPNNTDAIKKNIINRKGVGDIEKVIDLYKTYQSSCDSYEKDTIYEKLINEAFLIPNKSHPDAPIGDESLAKTVAIEGSKMEFDFPPKTVVDLGENLNLLRTKDVGNTTGHRTYYFLGQMADLENALVKMALRKLISCGFKLISVPDLINPEIIKGCGFQVDGERTQIYRLHPDYHESLCLAGTAEMSLAGLNMDTELSLSALPMKLASVSRCFRAETGDLDREKGIYRVHQFTKVEMFGLTANETGQESDNLLNEFVNIQKEMFTDLGLHFRILDMPTQELGAPAYRKFDFEAWMPGKEFYGEISSASNCTDFQSRRLNINYRNEDGISKPVHTVNGTACAVPRMIMAICENNQKEDSCIKIPTVLQKLMKNEKEIINSPKYKIPTWIKSKKWL